MTFQATDAYYDLKNDPGLTRKLARERLTRVGRNTADVYPYGYARLWIDSSPRPSAYAKEVIGPRTLNTQEQRVEQANTWVDISAAEKRDRILAIGKNQIPEWAASELLNVPAHEAEMATAVGRRQTMEAALATADDADLDTFDTDLDSYAPDPAIAAQHLINSPGDDGWAVGSIQMSLLATPPGLLWKLADGSDCTGTAYATATGNNTLPDLRGAYLRMAGQNGTNSAWDGGTLGDWQEDQTAKPDSFAIATHDGHTHNAGSLNYTQHRLNTTSAWTSGDYIDIKPGADSDHTIHTERIDISGSTGSAGAHGHEVSGWDAETRPKTYSVNYFIKVD